MHILYMKYKKYNTSNIQTKNLDTGEVSGKNDELSSPQMTTVGMPSVLSFSFFYIEVFYMIHQVSHVVLRKSYILIIFHVKNVTPFDIYYLMC